MTSKEALERLSRFAINKVNDWYKEDFKSYYELLLNDLEVLDILKRKECDVFELNKPMQTLEKYNDLYMECLQLTQDEFDKIKEWLERNDK